ncbi:MAG: LLM class F420-dependent oxidoreductase [Acidimicrobiales bacterium]|nr:LLM class F420-dependent oxidoreductase [Acidimicrobiales bacterium]
MSIPTTCETSAVTLRLGVVTPLPGLPLHQHRDWYRELVDLGYGELWVGESGDADAVTPLALAAAWAPELALGTAVVSSFTRPPGLLAMTAASLADAAPNRFTLGIGASSPAIVSGWNAIDFQRPVERTRDVVRFLRAAFTGDRVDDRYASFAIDGFRLGRRPESAPPVLVGALRPGMLRIAGAEGDGAVLTCLGAPDAAQSSEIVREAASEAGRPEPRIVAWVMVCASGDADAVRQAARRRLAGYLSAPAYRAFQAWLGHGEALAAFHERWDRGERREAASAIPDEIVDALVVHGSPEVCRDHLSRFVDSGVDTLLLEAMPGPVTAEDSIRLLAPP